MLQASEGRRRSTTPSASLLAVPPAAVFMGRQTPSQPGLRASATPTRSPSRLAAAPSAPGSALESTIPATLVDIAPDPDFRNRFIAAYQVETTVQNVPLLSEHGTNTESRNVTMSRGMRHAEGGWPKDVDVDVSDQTLKYRKKIEKDDAYFAAVTALCATVGPIIRQNAAIDVYETFTFDSVGAKAVHSEVARDGAAPRMLVAGSVVDPASYATSAATASASPPVSVHQQQSTHQQQHQPQAGEHRKGTDESSAPQAAGKAVQFDTMSLNAPDDDDGDFVALDGDRRSVTALSFSSHDTSRPSHIAVAFARRSAGRCDPGGPFSSALALRSRSRFRGPASLSANATVTAADDVESVPCYRSASLSFASDETGHSYIFDASRPSEPAMVLAPPLALRSVEYHPRDAHSVVGGTVGGTVVLFDTRRGSAPVLASLVSTLRDIVPKSSSASSTAPHATGGNATSSYPAWTLRHSPSQVLQVKWLQASGKANEIATADGTHRVLLWDVRAMNAPVDIVAVGLRGAESVAEVYRHGCTSIDFTASSPAAGRIFAGTSTGCIFALSRRGRLDSDRVVAVYGCHAGPVARVAKHPTIASLVASAADRSVHIWIDDQVESIATVDDATQNYGRVVDCCWHPTVPQLLLVLHLRGHLSAWALVSSSADGFEATPGGIRHVATVPTLSSKSGALATCLAVSSDGRHASVGTTSGTAVLVALQGLTDAFSSPTAAATAGDDGTVNSSLGERWTAFHAASWIAHHKKRSRAIHEHYRTLGMDADHAEGLFSTQTNRDVMRRAAQILRRGGSVAGGLTAEDVTFDDLPAEDETPNATQGHGQHRNNRGGPSQSQHFADDDELPDEEREINVWSSATRLSSEVRGVGAQFLAQLVGDELPGTYHDTITDAWSAAALAAEHVVELATADVGAVRPSALTTRSASPIGSDAKSNSVRLTPVAPRASTPASNGSAFRRQGSTPPPRML